jgi:hypothetical protein
VKLEESWMSFVDSVPIQYRVTKLEMRDGWTEAVRRHDQAEQFIRDLINLPRLRFGPD